MASKNKNPYREGSVYASIFDVIRKSQIVTRNQLIEAGFTVSNVTVILSPRAEGISTRGGDCRGNMSSQGHVYFMDKLNKKKGEVQRFRLRYRNPQLEQRVRPPKKDVKAQKASQKAVEVTAEVKTEVTEATA